MKITIDTEKLGDKLAVGRANWDPLAGVEAGTVHAFHPDAMKRLKDECKDCECVVVMVPIWVPKKAQPRETHRNVNAGDLK